MCKVYFFSHLDYFLIGNSFDCIAELMGIPSHLFVDTFESKVTDLMVDLVQYVQAMDAILNPPATHGIGGVPGTGPGVIQNVNNINTLPNPILLEQNPNGYPILPNPIPCNGWKKTTWDNLFTTYLGEQYRLACSGKKKHIPYKRIGENQALFIEPIYLPPATIFRPPRNIALDEMKSIFDHLLQRQQTHGPENTFKFKAIKLKGDTIPARYLLPADTTTSSFSRGNTGPDTRNLPETTTRQTVTGPGAIAVSSITQPRRSPRLQSETTDLNTRNAIDTTHLRNLPVPNVSDLPSSGSGTSPGPDNLNSAATERPRPRPKHSKIPKNANTQSRLLTDAELGTGTGDGYFLPPRTVDHQTMMKLNRLGVPSHLPTNGPNDGYPLYSVDAQRYFEELSVIDLENSQFRPNSQIDTNIDPNL
jgi:hypothetical protein